MKKKADFKEILDAGRRVSGFWGKFFYLPADQGFQVGIITSRKLGSAVFRNRIRRRIKEAIRESTKNSVIMSKIAIIPYSSVDKLPQSDLVVIMDKCFDKIRTNIC